MQTAVELDVKCRRQRQTMKDILCGSLLILLMTSVCAASANGKRLYDANCVGCHDASVFTRKDRETLLLATVKFSRPERRQAPR